LGFYKNLPGS